MPIGTPSVPYRLPGSQYERWVDIYTRLGVERILFLGGEVQPFAAAQLPAALQPFARRPLGARWAAQTHSSQRERLISCSIQSRARSASAKATSR